MSTVKKAPAPASLRFVGASSDGRTNRWRIGCECGRDFDPPTTRLGSAIETCPKCAQRWAVNYNAQTIKKASE